MINLTEADNNTIVKAKKGEHIDLTLTTNPSTGYLWQSVDTSAGTLDTVQQDAIKITTPPIVGKPVDIHFMFTVQQSGFFTLNCARPWGDITTPSKIFSVEVVVN